ncbi:MAG: hypothetical protein IPK85_05410 [Gemmatimonadetes bacterium]|nr:hypothetical protein [Gemmatimonadota bacterium]
MRGLLTSCFLLAASAAGAQGQRQAPWQRLPSDAIVARIDSTGQVTVNRQPVSSSSLDTLFVRIYSPRPDKTLFLQMAAGAPDSTRRRVHRVAAGAGVTIIPLPDDRSRAPGVRSDARAGRSSLRS